MCCAASSSEHSSQWNRKHSNKGLQANSSSDICSAGKVSYFPIVISHTQCYHSFLSSLTTGWYMRCMYIVGQSHILAQC